MKYRQGRVLEALHSVQAFLDKHGEQLAAINASGARKTVDAIAEELQSFAVEQDGGKRKAAGETQNQRALRLALRFAMRPLAAVATAKLREVPQIAALRLPSRRLRGLALVTAAHAMGDAATPHQEVFVNAGLAAEFIAQLRAAADALSESYGSRRENQTASAGATRGLLAAERRGRQALRILDTLVVPALGRDDAMLRGWRSARRIMAKPGPVQGEEDARHDGGSMAGGRAPGEAGPRLCRGRPLC